MEIDSEKKIGIFAIFDYRYRLYLVMTVVVVCLIVLWQFFPEIQIPKLGLSPEVKGKSTAISAEASVPKDIANLNLFVEVSGEVERPGVYQVSKSARVSDLVKLSGGLSKSADFRWVSKNINMALKLEDGDKIYIPYKGEILIQQSDSNSSAGIIKASGESVMASGSTGSSISKTSLGNSSTTLSTKSIGDGKINVNSASISQLDTLPGIGPVTADKIVKSRPYKDLKDLISKTKLKSSVANDIKDLISF